MPEFHVNVFRHAQRNSNVCFDESKAVLEYLISTGGPEINYHIFFEIQHEKCILMSLKLLKNMIRASFFGVIKKT